MIRYIIVMLALIPRWCASQPIHNAKGERDTCKQVAHYPLRYFERNGVEVHYPWQTTEKNCQFRSIVINHRISNGLTIGGSISLGIGAGLICAGLTLLSPKDPTGYQTGRVLMISGIGSAIIAIPFFVLAPKYQHASFIHMEKLKKL